MFTVTHVIAASTAACERQQAMRNLFAMDSVTARVMLTRVEDKLVSVFLSQQQQQQHSQHSSTTAQVMLNTDLHEADKVLRRLQGQTVSECNASKEEMSCLLRVHRQYGGLQGTEQALREENGSCVRMSWIYNALEGCKRVIAMQFLDGEIDEIDERPDVVEDHEVQGDDTGEDMDDAPQDDGHDDDSEVKRASWVTRSSRVKNSSRLITSTVTTHNVVGSQSILLCNEQLTLTSANSSQPVSQQSYGHTDLPTSTNFLIANPTATSVHSVDIVQKATMQRVHDNTLDNVTSKKADISQLDISQAELQAAENWIRGTPTRASLSPDVTMQADALVVGLKIISAYPAERTRSGIIRELMPGISVAKLGRFVVLVDDHIQNALLSKTAQQQFALDDLKTVDEILRQLDGRPVDDTTSNEDMACLLRCFRHFDGYSPLASALTKAHSQRVDPRWVATAVNSAKQLLAR